MATNAFRAFLDDTDNKLGAQKFFTIMNERLNFIQDPDNVDVKNGLGVTDTQINALRGKVNEVNTQIYEDAPVPPGQVTLGWVGAPYETEEGEDADVTLSFNNPNVEAVPGALIITVDGTQVVNDNVDVDPGNSTFNYSFGAELDPGTYDVVATFNGTPATTTLTVTDAPVTDYVVIPVTSADDLTTLNADTIRTTAGKDYVYFDFDFTGLGAGAAVNIANFADGDKLITGYPIDDTGLFIEGLTTDIAVAFGPNMTTFVGSWIANLEDQPAALLAEVQGTADLDTQINLIGAEYGAGWVVEALPA